jgi:hypothetical protein
VFVGKQTQTDYQGSGGPRGALGIYLRGPPAIRPQPGRPTKERKAPPGGGASVCCRGNNADMFIGAEGA